jgi:hypothetical protein
MVYGGFMRLNFQAMQKIDLLNRISLLQELLSVQRTH